MLPAKASCFPIIMNFIIEEHQQKREESHTTLHIRSPFDLLDILDSLLVGSLKSEFKTLQGELTPCPETQFCGPPHVILSILHLFKEKLVTPTFQQLIKAVEKRCDEILYNRNEEYLADPSFTQLVAERGLAIQSQEFCSECSRRKLEYVEPSFDVMYTMLIFCNNCGIIEKSVVNKDFLSQRMPQPWIRAAGEGKFGEP